MALAYLKFLRQALAGECPLFSLAFICYFMSRWQKEGVQPSLCSTAEFGMGCDGKQYLGVHIQAPGIPPSPHRLEFCYPGCTRELPIPHAPP